MAAPSFRLSLVRSARRSRLRQQWIRANHRQLRRQSQRARQSRPAQVVPGGLVPAAEPAFHQRLRVKKAVISPGPREHQDGRQAGDRQTPLFRADGYQHPEPGKRGDRPLLRLEKGFFYPRSPADLPAQLRRQRGYEKKNQPSAPASVCLCIRADAEKQQESRRTERGRQRPPELQPGPQTRSSHSTSFLPDPGCGIDRSRNQPTSATAGRARRPPEAAGARTPRPAPR